MMMREVEPAIARMKWYVPLVAAGDLVCNLILLMQLTPSSPIDPPLYNRSEVQGAVPPSQRPFPRGLPYQPDAIGAKFSQPLIDDFWFAPILAVSAVPVVGSMCALVEWRTGLWLYAVFAALGVGFRLFLLFETADRALDAIDMLPGHETRNDLIATEAAFFVCISHGLQVLRSTARLATLIDETHLERKVTAWSNSSMLPEVAPRSSDARCWSDVADQTADVGESAATVRARPAGSRAGGTTTRGGGEVIEGIQVTRF